MATFCRSDAKATAKERAFCEALLNNENPIWADDSDDVAKIRKRGFYLPPNDFVYGRKYPKQNGMSDVAAALQYNERSINRRKPIATPNFIAINKTAARLGLTKVRDIHQYRKTMNKHQIEQNCCDCPLPNTKPPSNITYGRVTSQQESIRDLLQNKYLHEWLRKTAIRRCKELLNLRSSSKTKSPSTRIPINNK